MGGILAAKKLMNYRIEKSEHDIVELKKSQATKDDIGSLKELLEKHIEKDENTYSTKSDIINLTKQVEKHNNVIERVFILESAVKVIDTRLKSKNI